MTHFNGNGIPSIGAIQSNDTDFALFFYRFYCPELHNDPPFMTYGVLKYETA
jgi:hypothetical protein